VPSVCNVTLSWYSCIGYYISRPNWLSSGVQVVVVKDSGAHCNAAYFSPVVVASGCFGYVGYHQFHLVVLGCTCLHSVSHRRHKRVYGEYLF
jgi:hypothetical protein